MLDHPHDLTPTQPFVRAILARTKSHPARARFARTSRARFARISSQRLVHTPPTPFRPAAFG